MKNSARSDSLNGRTKATESVPGLPSPVFDKMRTDPEQRSLPSE